MTTKRNILLALMIVLGFASLLYAGKPDRQRDRGPAPRGKGKPAMKNNHRRQPPAARPKNFSPDQRRGKRPNNKGFNKQQPGKKRPPAKPQPPRKQAKVVRVVRPQPREIVKVVHVYHDVLPYCEPNDRDVFNLTILNRTGRTLELELDGSHEGDDDIGKLHPGEGMDYPLVVKSKKLPETFELEAGPFELEFTLSHYSPRDLVLIVTPVGIYAE